MIYDYLFFKSYQLALKSKNFDDTPVLGGIWGVLPCAMLNFITLILLIDTIFRKSIESSGILSIGRYIFGVIFVLSLLFYYKTGGRWKKIIEKYESREKIKGRSIHPVIVLVSAYAVSVIIINIAAMYRNRIG